MSKRYLGGGISFEQKDVYQEFSEDDAPSPGGSSTLAGLTDVDISNPSNGQTLVYDATSEKWVNGESAGGGALTVNVTVHDYGEPTEYAIMDKTAGEIMNAINTGTPVIFQQHVTYENETVILFGAITEAAVNEANVETIYVFTLERVADSGDFYRGVYGCQGADGYPETMIAG